ncbi:hypothetical protein FFI94_007780 [Rhodococcus sp. KBS0724]|uniref:hypothetical protein n=1 Tax=Rhodococcus sp. KBS0724 TaxID=1179674 RepID=UPI00110D62F6|nr:hypothetical protein [Rhodococcus sp. KBS0724]TSD46072.1 hypothetical protein FFI94_007780 [Rhodococcus sp. KBS0724]
MGDKLVGCIGVLAAVLVATSCSSTVAGTPQAASGAKVTASPTAPPVKSAPTTAPTTVRPTISVAPAFSGTVKCSTLMPAVRDIVETYGPPNDMPNGCIWMEGGRSLAITSLTLDNSESTRNTMAKSGYDLQDPRLTKLGAVAKGGLTITVLSRTHMTMVLYSSDLTETAALDAAIRVVELVEN